MTLTQRFLRAKHWQLFLLIFGLPLIFQIFFMVTIISGFEDENVAGFVSLAFLIVVFLLILIICAGSYYVWMWSIALGLQNKIPGHIKMKLSKFKLFFFIPFIYMVLFFIGFGTILSGVTGIDINSEGFGRELLGYSMIIIFPLHLFSMFCILYTMYFIAKTIKTAELQRETKFSDFVGEFFMIWFYPIGIWMLQPKVNELADRPPADSITY